VSASQRRWFGLHLLSNQFPALHGLRFLAIVSVLQVHLTMTMLEAKLIGFTTLGSLSSLIWFGMDLFFILSGFLIGSMLIQQSDLISFSSLKRFYFRRSFRIFPLYYVTLVLLTIWMATPTQRSEVGYEFLYLTNYHFSPWHLPVMSWAWSLCVEEHFYLSVPLLVGALMVAKTHRQRLSLLFVAWGLGLVVRLWTYYTHQQPWNELQMFAAMYTKTHTRFDILVAGIGLAYIHRHFKDTIIRWLQSPWKRHLVITFSLLNFLLLISKMFWNNRLLWNVFAWGTITSLAYFSLLIWLLYHPGRIAQWLSSRWCLYLATLGYGIYLVHIPVCQKFVVPVARFLMFTHHWSLGLTWSFCLFLLVACSSLISYILHLVIEKPALWLRQRWVPLPDNASF
jgi:peptidoglycan/LPS O-acetylase OafA/YrhL